jgi:hypothetical protein
MHVRFEVGYAAVHWVDGYDRESLVYMFEVQGGQLFHGGIRAYDYGDGNEENASSKAILIEEFNFKADGLVRRALYNCVTDEVDIEDRHSVPVETHWEPIPALGNYDSLVR